MLITDVERSNIQMATDCGQSSGAQCSECADCPCPDGDCDDN